MATIHSDLWQVNETGQKHRACGSRSVITTSLPSVAATHNNNNIALYRVRTGRSNKYSNILTHHATDHIQICFYLLEDNKANTNMAVRKGKETRSSYRWNYCCLAQIPVKDKCNLKSRDGITSLCSLENSREQWRDPVTAKEASFPTCPS